MHTYTHTHNTYRHIYTHTHINAYTHIYTYTHAHIYTYRYKNTYKHTCTQWLWVDSAVQVYAHSVKNPDEIMEGAIPEMIESGPYIFDKTVTNKVSDYHSFPSIRGDF